MNVRGTRTDLIRCAIVAALLAATAAIPSVDPVRSAPAAAAAKTSPVSPPAASAGSEQPLVFVEHPTRPALDLRWRQALALVTGELTDWRTVDGRSQRVHLVLGPAAAARAAGIWFLTGRLPRTMTIARSETEAASTVARDTAAIGIVAGDALTPAVRAARVAGADPLHAPATYPLRVPGTRGQGPVISAIAFGDIMTSRTVDRKIMAAGDYLSPFRTVGPALKAADLAFGNFEGTISHGARPQPGGTRFVSRVGVIDGFRYAGIDFLSLANNHIGDFGAGTLAETVGLLRDAGIAVAGAGADLGGAREPAIVERRGVRFAFVSFNAIIGTRAAAPDSAGAVRIKMAPWFPFSAVDLAAVVENVKRARKLAEVVIVYPHWGQEYTSHPNADQIRVAHALIDAGADMLIATHPHWVQGAEVYKGHLIAYSLGNFVFDQTWSTETQEGAALQLTFWGPRLVGASFVPVRIEDAHRPRFLDDAAGANILRRIWGGSGEPYVLAARG